LGHGPLWVEPLSVTLEPWDSSIALHSGSHSSTAPRRNRGGDGFGPLPSRRPDLDDGLITRIRGGPEAAVRARIAISELETDLDPSQLETLRLLVTELVANSVRHAQADAITLRVVVGRSSVLAEVSDPGPGFDPAGTGSPRGDHTGWGLYLVEQLAQRWGVSRNGRSSRVWFELPREQTA
jgi:anti-sigma regulatory factor (Ser/Thr protein kinase)